MKMHSGYSIQIITLITTILFMYSLLSIQYYIWKLSGVKQSSSNKNLFINRKNKILSRHKRRTLINSKNYTILLWQGNNSFNMAGGDLLNCYSLSNCQITNDASQIADYVAVAIFIDNNIGDIPQYKYSHQKWILVSTGLPPPRDWFRNMSSNEVIDAIASYTGQGDIQLEYGKIRLRDSGVTLSFDKGKTKFAAVIYNGHRTRRLTSYIKELQNYIPLHIYSNCSNYNALLDTINDPLDSCLDTIGNNYKFYIDLESLSSQGYLAKSLWRILKTDTVPVLFGPVSRADHHRLPQHSYIDTHDFQSVQELSTFLKLLDRNDKLYRNHFEWKKHYTVELLNEGDVFCKLCEYMNRSHERQRSQKKIT